MQNANLFAKHPPDDQQRLDQYGQVGKVLDQLLDPGLKLRPSHYANRETEVARKPARKSLSMDMAFD